MRLAFPCLLSCLKEGRAVSQIRNLSIHSHVIGICIRTTSYRIQYPPQESHEIHFTQHFKQLEAGARLLPALPHHDLAAPSRQVPCQQSRCEKAHPSYVPAAEAAHAGLAGAQRWMALARSEIRPASAGPQRCARPQKVLLRCRAASGR